MTCSEHRVAIGSFLSSSFGAATALESCLWFGWHHMMGWWWVACQFLPAGILSRLLAGATDGMNNFTVMGYVALGMVASSFSIYSLMGNGKKLEG